MTQFKRGDKVHVEFDAEIDIIHDNGMVTVSYEYSAVLTAVPLSSLTKIKEALPTKIGSVIHVTDWVGLTDDSYVAMLTVAGWRLAVDKTLIYSDAEIEHNAEWELIYVPGQ